MQVSTYIIRVSKYQHMISKYPGYPYIEDGDLTLVQLDNLILSMSNMDYVAGYAFHPSFPTFPPSIPPEVLSRHTTAENFFPGGAPRRKSNLQDIPEVPSMGWSWARRSMDEVIEAMNLDEST